jgi:dihydrofolate synthase / folylpolyglutamate synthase
MAPACCVPSKEWRLHLMTYPQAIEFLYSLRLFGMKLGLDNTRRLAAALGDPHHHLRFTHVAGTNGKGSTCAMLEGIYRAAGWRTGLFTSPHLVSFAERIQVGRQLISQEDVARLTNEIRAAIDAIGAETPPTFFEVVTVMALKYFAEQKCEVVIWETGLGGRLDATNIVTPLASVITNVQLDHQQWLGQSLPEIAREKAGIIKPGVPALTATDDASALSVIAEVAREQHAPLTIVTEPAGSWEVALAGEHQKRNAALALAVVRVLQPLLPAPESAQREGLKTTHWDGRMQIAQQPDGRLILLDGAHNPAGAQALAAALRTGFAGRTPALILGTMADKDYAAICRWLAPAAAKIFLCPIASDRGADPRWLADCCRSANAAAEVAVCSNIAQALAQAAQEPFVVVTGSLHFVGEAMQELGLASSDSERGLNDYGATQAFSGIQAVTFDVGGTLIEPWPSVGRVYAEVAARHGLEVAAEDLDRQFARAWAARKNFSYRLSDWLELVRQTFAGLTPAPPSASLFAALYSHFATAGPWRIFDDVTPCLRELKRRGLKLGIISNWDERLRPLLRELQLDNYFDSIVISGPGGPQKPEAKIFQAAAAQLNTRPEAILHIGDSASEDLAGARAAGLRAMLLSRNDAVGLGSATVPIALAGVPPANPSSPSESPFGALFRRSDVFGETPKTAVETTALPKATASFRLSRGQTPASLSSLQSLPALIKMTSPSSKSG